MLDLLFGKRLDRSYSLSQVAYLFGITPEYAERLESEMTAKLRRMAPRKKTVRKKRT
jgi:DNA-directed RNA polymerase sigma subunit (sigma70/sigma32)